MATKLGHHQTMDKATKLSIDWLDGRDEVRSLILAGRRPRSHSRTAGTLAFEEKTSTGLCLTAYGDDGIRQVFVETDQPDVIKALVEERWPVAKGGKRKTVKTTMEAAFEAAKTKANGKPKAERPSVLFKAPPPVLPAKPITVEDLGAVCSTDVRYELREITPEMAFTLLSERNQVNRRINELWVNLLKQIILRGDWDPEAGIIMFCREGNLINGQHRLRAIFDAGVTVKCRVAYNVDPATRGNIDTISRRRTDVDIARMLRGQDTLTPLHFATAVRAYFRGGRRTNLAYGRLLPNERQEIMGKWQDAVNFALGAVRNSTRLLMASGLAAIARASFTVDAEKLREFGEVMHSGYPTHPSHQPIILLRNWLGSPRKRREESHNQDVYRKTSRALKAFLDGEELDKLFPAKDEYFPVADSLEAPEFAETE